MKKQHGNLVLDVDVKDGLGPETLTVNLENGVSYYFYVHHFEGKSSLSRSGAKLKVYGVPGIDTLVIPVDITAAYGLPDNQKYKGFWHGFVLEADRTVRIVNQIVRDTKGAQTGRTF